MESSREIPLVLGGHSFFSPLGNEPVPGPATQRDIVAACLDAGLVWFDTTHQPERLALGRALSELGRRREAKIIAWNFLKKLAPDEKLDRPVAYQPHHIEQLCEELRTDYIDAVVVHDLDDGTPKVHAAQETVVREWIGSGIVGTAGVWAPGEDVAARYGGDTAFTFMVQPMNVTTPENGASFERCKSLGWRTLACSPFLRGWALDKLVEKAMRLENGEAEALRARLADALLRHSLFHPHVDMVITAIRRMDWIRPNVESAQRGPLSQLERDWLEQVERA